MGSKDQKTRLPESGTKEEIEEEQESSGGEGRRVEEIMYKRRVKKNGT